MRFMYSLLTGAIIVTGLGGYAQADDQTVLGAGNANSAATAAASELIGSALTLIRQETAKLNDTAVRRQTVDALFNAQTCIRHRANLTAAAKQAIVDQLVAEGLLGAHDGDSIPGGLIAGVFPPVRDDGTACPHLPQPVFAAPGGGQHHAYPGGLIVHEAFNLRSALSFVDSYRAAAGFRGADGLPRVGPIGESIDRNPSITINQDELRAAPIWHDWAKAIVFQWNADGTLFRELGIAGTGGHHILGVAETIARGLPAELIVVQVSAHTPPNTDNEGNVVRWLRAASIIAGVDPVARGLLAVASDGNLHLPPVRRLGDLNHDCAHDTQQHNTNTFNGL